MVKIFVGNLGWDDTTDDLRDMFNKFGEILDCEKLDQKQFGFVHMKEYNDAQAAVKQLNSTQHKGKRMRVEISTSKPTKIFIGNLNPSTTNDDLRKLFEDKGLNVVEADVVEGKRFGFVHAESTNGYREINKAVRDANGTNIRGNSVRIEISEGKKDGGQGRDRGQGGYNDNGGSYGGGGYGGSSGGYSGGGGGYGRDSRRSSTYPSASGGGRWHGAPALGQPYPAPVPTYSASYSESWDMGGGYGASNSTSFGESWTPGAQSSYSPKMMSSRSSYKPLQSGSMSNPLFDAPRSNLTTVPLVSNDGIDALQKYESEMFQYQSTSLVSMLETGQLADYQLGCEGNTIRVHKVILASKSQKFLALINNYPNMGMVSDIEYTTLQTLIKFMYSGSVDISNINPNSIMKLLNAAENYQVGMVKEGLEAALIKNLSVNNAVDFLIVSEELTLTQLKNTAKKFICSRAKEMKEREDFRVKLKEYPHLMLELFDAAAN